MQHYDTEVIAQANALEVEGVSARRTVERLRGLFPDGEVPAFTTVAEWRRKAHEFAHEELEDNELVIGLQADEVVVAKLKWAKNNIDKARLAELVMAAGVYRDKGFKRKEKPPIQTQKIQINFVSTPKPE